MMKGNSEKNSNFSVLRLLISSVLGLRVAVVAWDVTGGGTLHAAVNAASFLLALPTFTACIYYTAGNRGEQKAKTSGSISLPD